MDQTQNTVSIHGDLTQTLGDVETFADFNTRRRRSAEENSVAESVLKEISDGFRPGDGCPMNDPLPLLIFFVKKITSHLLRSSFYQLASWRINVRLLHGKVRVLSKINVIYYIFIKKKY